MTIGQKIMLEQITTSSINSESLQNELQENQDLQLPGSIAQLGTSLAYVKMTDLMSQYMGFHYFL